MTRNSFSSATCNTPLRGSTDKAFVIVDAHVHIHDCFNPVEFFDHAFENLQTVAVSLEGRPAFTGILILTESAEYDYFTLFARTAGSQKLPTDFVNLGPWTFVKTDEPSSLLVTNGDKRLILIAGQQVAAAEDLEVLMLGTNRKVKDGQPIRDLLEYTRLCGAPRVIPWGAGKWFFGRGDLLSELIQSNDPDDFFLGDEGGRPIFWPTPRHFKEAARREIRVLPGTDPLPFPWEISRVGTFGFWFYASMDWSKPSECVLAALRDPGVKLHPFGKLEKPFRFFRNQFGMQMRKRRKSRLGSERSHT
jgi:hypothetical protein